MRPNICEVSSIHKMLHFRFCDVISLPNCDSIWKGVELSWMQFIYWNFAAFTEGGQDGRNTDSIKEGETWWHLKGEFERPCSGTSSFNFDTFSLATSCSPQNEAYWNVMVFCCDGTLALNRLSVGLIFPQLQDEISVICPVRPNFHNSFLTVKF